MLSDECRVISIHLKVVVCLSLASPMETEGLPWLDEVMCTV